MGALGWSAEQACLNAWPALHSIFHGDWLLRFADGLSRRANSVNPLRPDARPMAEALSALSELYRAQGLPLIVRAPTFLDGGIERELEAGGFRSEGESCVLYGDIPDVARKSVGSVQIATHPDDDWFAAMRALQRHSAAQATTYRRIIDGIVVPTGFASMRRDGDIVAVAYGALHDGLMACESVVVSERYRGQGIGTTLMAELYGWAEQQGARGICLQVEAANERGRALYRSLGLRTELYRYRYWRAATS